jgi:predicted nucleotidyltransferase
MMAIPEPAKRLRRQLEGLYGARLRRVLVYGSYARGDHTNDSDIDVAVVLDGPVEPGREIDRMLDVVHGVNLAFDTLVSVYPVSEEDYKALRSPLLMNIRREGVAA